MRYLITKKEDGSIMDSGYFREGSAPPNAVVELLKQEGVKAVSLDLDNGTRVRYEQ